MSYFLFFLVNALIYFSMYCVPANYSHFKPLERVSVYKLISVLTADLRWETRTEYMYIISKAVSRLYFFEQDKKKFIKIWQPKAGLEQCIVQ